MPTMIFITKSTSEINNSGQKKVHGVFHLDIIFNYFNLKIEPQSNILNINEKPIKNSN
jgi:hypothetical protein